MHITFENISNLSGEKQGGMQYETSTRKPIHEISLLLKLTYAYYRTKGIFDKGYITVIIRRSFLWTRI